MKPLLPVLSERNPEAMTNRSARLILATFAVLTALPLVAGVFDPVQGIWDCVAITPDGAEIRTVVEAREEAANLVVSVTIDEVKRAATDVKSDGKSFSFNVIYQDSPYAISGRVEGNTLIGSWSGSGMSGEFRGSRRH